MRRILHIPTYAATALLLASAPALAQMPSDPGNQTGPYPAPTNGGLMVAVWDDIRGVSLIEYLGFTYNSFQPELVTPEAGGTINFGVLQQWSSVFGTSLATNIRYEVFAGGYLGGAPTASGRILTTRANPLAAAPNNDSMAGAGAAIFNFTNTELNEPTGCAGVNPCITSNNGQLGYAGGQGGNQLGPRYSNQLPSANNASALVGTSLSFFRMTSNSDDDGLSPGTLTRYGNSENFAQWLLTASGELTYSLAAAAPVVPLPAGVWLLISGLAGLGAVSRRRAGQQLSSEIR